MYRKGIESIYVCFIAENSSDYRSIGCFGCELSYVSHTLQELQSLLIVLMISSLVELSALHIEHIHIFRKDTYFSKTSVLRYKNRIAEKSIKKLEKYCFDLAANRGENSNVI